MAVRYTSGSGTPELVEAGYGGYENRVTVESIDQSALGDVYMNSRLKNQYRWIGSPAPPLKDCIQLRLPRPVHAPSPRGAVIRGADAVFAAS